MVHSVSRKVKIEFLLSLIIKKYYGDKYISPMEIKIRMDSLVMLIVIIPDKLITESPVDFGYL